MNRAVCGGKMISSVEGVGELDLKIGVDMAVNQRVDDV